MSEKAIPAFLSSPEEGINMAVLYVALLLTEESKKKLLEAFPPKHPKVFAEHLTVIFKPPEGLTGWMPQECEDITYPMTICGYAEDEKGQAVAIKESYRIGGGIGHVTISCAEGVKPVYSNELLAKGYTPVHTEHSPYVLEGRLKFIEGK